MLWASHSFKSEAHSGIASQRQQSGTDPDFDGTVGVFAERDEQGAGTEGVHALEEAGAGRGGEQEAAGSVSAQLAGQVQQTQKLKPQTQKLTQSHQQLRSQHLHGHLQGLVIPKNESM